MIDNYVRDGFRIIRDKPAIWDRHPWKEHPPNFYRQAARGGYKTQAMRGKGDGKWKSHRNLSPITYSG